jgi:hypothetical protein
MSYNFKSIADVEVVAEPTESANVLIEENGVIKKAPKTAVGGGSNNGLLAIFYDFSQGYEPISAPDNLYEILDESLKNMTPVNIVGCQISSYEEDRVDYDYLTYIHRHDEGDCINFHIGTTWVDCYSDGRIELGISD